MLAIERTLYAFTLKYCRLLTADLDDARLADLPAPGMNHPAWILGHLAIATDFAAKCLGEPTVCPAEWHKQFGPGSQVVPDRAAYPSKDDLLSALEQGCERVSAAAANVTERRLSLPNPAVLKEELPTIGALLGHLLTTHPATHLGQLSAWRRFYGLPSVLKI